MPGTEITLYLFAVSETNSSFKSSPPFDPVAKIHPCHGLPQPEPSLSEL